jgi:hypothetical protein
VRGIQQTRWRSFGRESGARSGRTVEGALQAGRGHSGEQSWPRGWVIGCAEADASFGEGCGMPRAKAQARGGAKSTRRRAGVVDQRVATSASTNSPQRERNRGKKGAWMVPYLVTVLGDTWRGVWSSRWSARQGWVTGELGRRRLSAREAGSR